MNDFHKKPLDLATAETNYQRQLSQLHSEQALAEGFQIAEMYLNKNYLDIFQYVPINRLDDRHKSIGTIRLYMINKIVFDPTEEVNDRLISVYNAIYNFDGTVAIIISGTPEDVSFYIAVQSDTDVKMIGDTMCAALQGNFPGISLSVLGNEDKESVLNNIYRASYTPKSIASVSLVPSVRDQDKDRFVQGMEKFIDGMLGCTYTAVLLAVSVNKETLKQRRHGYEMLYSYLSPYKSNSMSYSHSDSESVGESLTRSFSDSINQSVSNTNGSSKSYTSGTSVGYSSNTSFSSGSSSDGHSFNASFSSGETSGSSESYTSGTSFSNTVSSSVGHSLTDSAGTSKNNTTSDTTTKTLEFENKGVQNLLDQAESQLQRIHESESMGMWETGCYFLSDDSATTARAVSLFKSLMIGDETYVENTKINIWGYGDEKKIALIAEHIKYLHHPSTNIQMSGKYVQNHITPTNLISGKELPIILGIPRKSVPGLPVIEMAEFGRAVVYERPESLKRKIEFGSIYHMGNAECLRVSMNLDLLSSHCFITGSSGSGKSYATYQLLDAALAHGIKMLVIEPAKGEYKQVFGGMEGINIYNTDPQLYQMLKINPFKFPENISLLTHMEKLMQIFNASWTLTAAMPAILKEAVIRAYVDCGWDVDTSVWIPGLSKRKYPIFQDVLKSLPQIINESDYSAEAKGDYKGALLTRVQSMTSGISGFIFEDDNGLPNQKLFDENTIIDLSEIGSEETIALIMGIVIMKLGEYRLSVRKANTGGDTHDSDLQHMTILEEAHNLLKRTNHQGSGDIVGKSVEMISNSIKEMRTYGEGFIIIDQSPMAVDTSAIENTSTKIIMNTPAKDACDELGGALSLTDEQTRELSRMDVGVAAVFQKGWLTPVLMKVDRAWNSAKYSAKLQTVDFSELRILRGILISELLRQAQTGQFDFGRMQKRIQRTSALNKDQKKKFEDILNFYREVCENNGSLDTKEIGDFLIQLAQCRGLFRIIKADEMPTPIEVTERRKKMEAAQRKQYRVDYYTHAQKWFFAFAEGLDQYAYDLNLLEKLDMTRFMLDTLTENGSDKQSPYSTIRVVLEGEWMLKKMQSYIDHQ